MSTVVRIGATLRRLRHGVFCYDDLHHEDRRESGPRRAMVAILMLFVLAGGLAVGLGLIENKPTTASTGLVAAHRFVAMNGSAWFSEGIWWRGKQTPTPLPFTIHGVFFFIFGYTIQGILLLHTLAGGLSGWLLCRITARRFGPWTGVLALLLYLSAPLVLYVIFSGWTFVWATLFLLLCIDLLDRAVLTRRIPWYLLAAVALSCAGMSRPENYAVALLVVLFVEIPWRYRAAFVLIALAYPIAQYVHNNVCLGDRAGLRILEDRRIGMTYLALFIEWFNSIRGQILNRNFAPLLQWGLLPAVAILGMPRRRFLTGVVLYFCVALFSAYALRRISFNHEGYYYAHVTLMMPFVAAGLMALASLVCRAAGRWGMSPRRAAQVVGVVLVVLLAGQGLVLRDAYATRVGYRVPESVREVRDFLVGRLNDSDRIALDYFAEVSWMLAEIEGPGGRDAWSYGNSMHGVPRPPLNPARKDIREEELPVMNAWVANNFRAWVALGAPRYLVTQTDGAWEAERVRKGATGHYRMFSLRPALGLRSLERIPLGVGMLRGQVVFENEGFVIYELISGVDVPARQT